MYAPMFKCNTNPRAVTAHRWNTVDVIGRMAKPTGMASVYLIEGYFAERCRRVFL
jgi:hypothetical protein